MNYVTRTLEVLVVGAVFFGFALASTGVSAQVLI
jgi:hypothetical protein